MRQELLFPSAPTLKIIREKEKKREVETLGIGIVQIPNGSRCKFESYTERFL